MFMFFIRDHYSTPNSGWLLSLDDARGKVESWRKHCNSEHPRGALDNLAPLEYASPVR